MTDRTAFARLTMVPLLGMVGRAPSGAVSEDYQTFTARGLSNKKVIRRKNIGIESYRMRGVQNFTTISYDCGAGIGI